MSPLPAINDQQIAVVKSTLPVLADVGPAITEHFYRRLFEHHPELQNIFNMSHQAKGQQQKALFGAIAAYAQYIDDLPALSAAVERIANKHTSLNIQPEHYPIVGHHLIETLRELLGDAFTTKIEDAWGAAYALLAQVFINTEEAIYQAGGQQFGGWRGARKFRLVEKRIESELVKSLIFSPVDGQPVASYRPGQYLGIKVKVPGKEFEEIRQYSLSDRFNGESYRISVKRETGDVPGVVSNYLHDGLRLGQEVELFPPAGDFFYQEKPAPTVLVSAGVGITPMQSILETIAGQREIATDQSVVFLHACENPAQHTFGRRLRELSEQLPLTHHVWYRDAAEDQPNAYQGNAYTGFMDFSAVKSDLPIEQGNFYLCGPVAFMQFAKQQLTNLGVAAERIFYEVFGPHEAF